MRVQLTGIKTDSEPYVSTTGLLLAYFFNPLRLKKRFITMRQPCVCNPLSVYIHLSASVSFITKHTLLSVFDVWHLDLM